MNDNTPEDRIEMAHKAQDDLFHAAAGNPNLIKYDCPNANCTAWFITLNPLNVLCKDCSRTMVASDT